MENHIKTYKDFPEFYNHPFIKSIADNERWTVSDDKKVPLDVKHYIDSDQLWGLAFNRGYNPCVTLDKLCDILPTAANNAYYLDAMTENFVVMDVEPKCPDNIKQKLLELPYIYGEVSMSGNGLHLIFALPQCIKKYPIAQNKVALKEEHGYYEILMNHMVTFTRNMIAPAKNIEHFDTFENIFELLAMKATETKIKEVDIEEIDSSSIPNYNSILKTLLGTTYKKTLDDFFSDNSRYEYGMTGFYYAKLKQILNNKMICEQHIYTDNEKAWILYDVLQQNLDYRPKHDEIRNNLPWLLYIATSVIGKDTPIEEQFTENATIKIQGEVTFSRISKQLSGEKLKKDNERRKNNGWNTIDVPYTSITITNATIIPNNPNDYTPEEKYIAEKINNTANFTGKSNYTGYNKTSTIPNIQQLQPDKTYKTITLKPGYEIKPTTNVTIIMCVETNTHDLYLKDVIIEDANIKCNTI